MISTHKLRAAAEQALAQARSAPGVREVEVFAASNGSLLTRLNYTSQIPCNGVEEPKSTESYGIGLQVAFDDPDGVKVGFGSETSDLSPEGVRSALEKARRGAVHDPEFVSLARPTGEKRNLTRYHDPDLMSVGDDDLVGAGWRVVNSALETFLSSEELVALAGSREGLRDLGLIVGGDVTILQERIAVGSTHLPKVQTDESTLILSQTTSMVEGKDSKGSGWSVGTRLADFDGRSGWESARNAIRSIDGRRVKSGRYRVVFGHQPVTDLLNNLILPSLNLGSIYAGSSAFLGKLGQTVASADLSIYDDGATPGLAGSKGITCEGLPTGRTVLIEAGRMVGTLANFYESSRIRRDPQAKAKLGADPNDHPGAFVPRNGFRFGLGGGRSFDMPPGIAPTNVIVQAANPLPSDDLLRAVGNGIYVGRIWYTYPVNGLNAGDFTCTVTADSYLIENGRIVAPVKPNTIRINDNIRNVLESIIGIGADRRGTLVWAADEVVYAPEIAVADVMLDEIASGLDAVNAEPM
ncbi:MAG TPA: metallopeptidase TldD-related protein [Dehalococcoidia bacterium]|nr:metallopeptidase TldD-related protein [Dehalococcoidia bacterium]